MDELVNSIGDGHDGLADLRAFFEEGSEETVEQTLAALRDEGLIEWNGAHRNGRRVWVATEKGIAVAERLGIAP